MRYAQAHTSQLSAFSFLAPARCGANGAESSRPAEIPMFSNTMRCAQAHGSQLSAFSFFAPARGGANGAESSRPAKIPMFSNTVRPGPEPRG
jgi:hypothetical protein